MVRVRLLEKVRKTSISCSYADREVISEHACGVRRGARAELTDPYKVGMRIRIGTARCHDTRSDHVQSYRERDQKHIGSNLSALAAWKHH